MPSKASEEFAKALEELGVDVNVNLYPGKTHTGISALLRVPTAFNCFGLLICSFSFFQQIASWKISSWAIT